MSSEIVSKLLEEKLKTFWGSRTPISWDNVDYNSTIGQSFIRCTIEQTDTDVISLSCQREHYLMRVEIYTASNIGTIENLIAADDIISEFFNFKTGNLLCLSGRVERVGNEQNWHQRNVFIEVRYDQHF